MDNLVSFSLVPSSYRECYVVANLKFNRLLVGFSGEKEVDGMTYEFKIYSNSVSAYTNGGKGNTYKTIFNIERDCMINENVIDDIQNVLKLFKSEMQEYVERKKKWEQKNKINISV